MIFDSGRSFEFKFTSEIEPAEQHYALLPELPDISPEDSEKDFKQAQDLPLAPISAEDNRIRENIHHEIKSRAISRSYVSRYNVNQRYRGQFPLHVAVWYGDRETLENILIVNPWVNVVNWQGFTPMALAASLNRVSLMKRLKERQAYVVGLEGYKRVIHPLVAAINGNAFEAVAWLIENNATVESDEIINAIINCKDIAFLTRFLQYLNQRPVLLAQVMRIHHYLRIPLLNHLKDLARVEKRKITEANAQTPEGMLAQQFCDEVMTSYRVMIFTNADHQISYDLLYPYEKGLVDNLRWKRIIPFKTLMSAQELTPQQVAEQYNIAMHFRAERNIGNARYELGMLYQEGSEWRLVQQEPQLALYWFLRGARSDNVDCCFALAKMLLEGNGVSQDTVQGYRFLRQAVWLSDEHSRGFHRDHDAYKRSVERATTIKRYRDKNPPGYWGYFVDELEHYYYHTSDTPPQEALLGYFDNPYATNDKSQQEALKVRNRQRYDILIHDRILPTELRHQTIEQLRTLKAQSHWVDEAYFKLRDANKEKESSITKVQWFQEELCRQLDCKVTASKVIASGHVTDKDELKRLRITMGVVSFISGAIPFVGGALGVFGVAISAGVETFLKAAGTIGSVASGVPSAAGACRSCRVMCSPTKPLDQKHVNTVTLFTNPHDFKRLSVRLVDIFGCVLNKVAADSMTEVVAWVCQHIMSFMEFVHVVKHAYADRAIKDIKEDKLHDLVMMWMVYGNVLLDKKQKDTSETITLVSGERVTIAQLFQSAGVCAEWHAPGVEPALVEFDLIVRDKETGAVIFNTQGARYGAKRLLFPMEREKIEYKPVAIDDELRWQVGDSFMACPGLCEATHELNVADAHLETLYSLRAVLSQEQQQFDDLYERINSLEQRIQELDRRVVKVERGYKAIAGQLSHVGRQTGVEIKADTAEDQKAFDEAVSLQERLERAEQEIRQLRSTNIFLSKSETILKKKIETLEEKEQKSEQRISQLEDDIISLKEIIARMQQPSQHQNQATAEPELPEEDIPPQHGFVTTIPRSGAGTRYGLYSHGSSTHQASNVRVVRLATANLSTGDTVITSNVTNSIV